MPSFNFSVLNASTLLLSNINISYLPLLEAYPSGTDNSDWPVSTAELKKKQRKKNRAIFRTIDEKLEYWATLNERGAVFTSQKPPVIRVERTFTGQGSYYLLPTTTIISCRQIRLFVSIE